MLSMASGVIMGMSVPLPVIRSHLSLVAIDSQSFHPRVIDSPGTISTFMYLCLMTPPCMVEMTVKGMTPTTQCELIVYLPDDFVLS